MKIRYFNYLFNHEGEDVVTSLLSLFKDFTRPLKSDEFRHIEISEQPYYLISSDKADNLFYLVTMSANDSQKYFNKKSLDLSDLHDRLLENELLGSITYICLSEQQPYLSVLSTLGSPRYHHLELFVNGMVEKLGKSSSFSNFNLVEMCEEVSKEKLETMELVVDAGFTLDKDSSKFDAVMDAFGLGKENSEEVGQFRVFIDRAPKTTLKGCLRTLINKSESHEISNLTARCKADPFQGALSELALDASNALSENIYKRERMTIEEQIATKLEENQDAIRLNNEFLRIYNLERFR
ncbi:hypothetical protein CWC31_02595 [Pseudoalteromonas ruthenica]|uniref:hypothetical protein n=1 Tax=Pseudoalteromonas ruthenica TaxID=151081 RepID=UPI001108AF60|nr:hypothetical protein [Pseudoalteromonas ruthenica]TLX52057.1 hypothetical protein CWC31_02595 [Pseudoalteromonas ruthenica]